MMEKDITSLTPEQLAVISQAATILQALSVHDTIETGDILAHDEENVNMKRIESYEHKIFFSSGNWYVKLPDGKRIRRKKREDIEKIVIDIQKEREAAEKEPPVMSATEIWEAWQKERLEEGLAGGSTSLRDQSTFNQYFKGKELVERPISDTTREEWTQVLKDVIEKRPTAKEFARIKGVVTEILHHAEDAGYITYTAEEVIRYVRIRKKSFTVNRPDPASQVYLPDELKKLKEYCLEHPNPYTRCILMAIITGVRPGECAPCHIDDVDLEAQTLSIRRTETRADENGKPAETIREGAKTDAGIRTVAIPECDIAWVEGVVENARKYSDEWLFPQEPDRWKTRYVGTRIRTQQLRRNMVTYCEEAGIEYKPPHKLRKTYASILAANGIPDAMRTAQMGHVDVKTTKEYYEFDRETSAEKAQKLGKISELELCLEKNCNRAAAESLEESPENILQKNEDPEMP